MGSQLPAMPIQSCLMAPGMILTDQGFALYLSPRTCLLSQGEGLGIKPKGWIRGPILHGAEKFFVRDNNAVAVGSGGGERLELRGGMHMMHAAPEKRYCMFGGRNPQEPNASPHFSLPPCTTRTSPRWTAGKLGGVSAVTDTCAPSEMTWACCAALFPFSGTAAAEIRARPPFCSPPKPLTFVSCRGRQGRGVQHAQGAGHG